VIKSPITGPYWTQIDGKKLVFNEQLGNEIAVFDIEGESLVEYEIPSRNPNWADCGMHQECGIAQAFGLKSAGDRIWFTEWAENNIGVVDLSKKLPLDFKISQKEITLNKGQTAQLQMQLVPSTNTDVTILSRTTAEFGDVTVSVPTSDVSLQGPQTIPVSVSASEFAIPGTYKALLSARTDDVTISQFVTVNVVQ